MLFLKIHKGYYLLNAIQFPSVYPKQHRSEQHCGNIRNGLGDEYRPGLIFHQQGHDVNQRQQQDKFTHNGNNNGARGITG